VTITIMDKLNEAVDSFSQRLEKEITPGLSYKQFTVAAQLIEDSVLLVLGDNALDHFIHKKFREQVSVHRARLQDECERKYVARCFSAQQQLFQGADDLRQDVFQNLAKYSENPLCVENDWDKWSSSFLGACGLGPKDVGEETRLLLEVFKSSATRLVAGVKADAQQQVNLFKQAMMTTNEHLDQSSLDIMKLQGEKENQMAVCRSLESRILELQNQQAKNAEVIRDLEGQVSMSRVEVKACKEEVQTTGVKYEKLVARLVAKSKEVSTVAAEKRLLSSENDSLKRVQQYQGSAGKKSKRSGSEGGNEEMLSDLTVTYSKQVLELQEALDAVTDKYNNAVESGECAEKLMLMDKEKMEHLTDELRRVTEHLNAVQADVSRLEDELSSKAEVCKSMEKVLTRTQECHKTNLTNLREHFTLREQELVSQVTLLNNQISKDREEQLTCAGHLEQAHAEVRRLASALALAEMEPAVTASQGTVEVTSGSNEEFQEMKLELNKLRENLHSEQAEYKKKMASTLQTSQNRINEIDMAYFRVEAELKIKTGEAKKYFSKVKQLEEEACAQDRLRRKAELKVDEETQKRLAAEKTTRSAKDDLETAKESLRLSKDKLSDVQRQLEIMKLTHEATVQDMATLQEKNTILKEAAASYRGDASRLNYLDYELSEMTKAKESREGEISVLQAEVAALTPLQKEVVDLKAQIANLQTQIVNAEAAVKAVAEKDERSTEIMSQFDELTKMNNHLLQENKELEEQAETISLAFSQRGDLLQDLERRLDVSTSDAAYLRGDNKKAREQVRELGEKVQTLMLSYNEASSQNEEKGFALLQLNGQQHELQANFSKLANELTELRDLPAQMSQLQEEHADTKAKLSETLATLDELSLLSASDMQEKDLALANINEKYASLVKDNEAVAKEHEVLVTEHSALVADRENLFFAYTALDNKLTELEAGIRE